MSERPRKAKGFDRTAIESAMDAFESGKHSDYFDQFRKPKYWVRSTRNRKNRVFPTMPIVGFIGGKKKRSALTSGWTFPQDSGSKLYNSGYVIVDENDQPFRPPNDHPNNTFDHLIRDEDHIRLCAMNYHIEPARERNGAHVSIQAGSLARELGIEDVNPVCCALGGKAFQELANLPPPMTTEQNPSASTVFTYQLASTEGLQPMASTQRPKPSRGGIFGFIRKYFRKIYTLS